MQVQELLNPIANLGFPIVLSIYLLVRLESRMESLTISLQELAQSINSMEKIN
ncbi:MAG: YvrJ family protein [Tindallia sp. MSAO_Bac2]|nr:MAG: YvrJ family protein [Tindallia sp. MSAO_Bac2]